MEKCNVIMDLIPGADKVSNPNVPIIGNVPDGMDVVVISTKNLVDLFGSTVKESTRAKMRTFITQLTESIEISDMALIDYKTILTNELESVNLNLDLQELAATFKADQVAKTI